MTGARHPNIELVVAALDAAGADPPRIERMRVLPDAVTTAAAAAAALGVEVGQIANSLVFDARRRAAAGADLGGAPGGHRQGRRVWSAWIGCAGPAPEFVRAATGQAIGGVAPVGHPAPLRTLVDRALARTTRCGRRAESRMPSSRARSTSW